MHKRKLLDINNILGISIAGIVFELFFLTAEYYMLYLRDDNGYFSFDDTVVDNFPVVIILIVFMLLVILLGVGFYIMCYSLIGLVLTLIRYYVDKDKKI